MSIVVSGAIQTTGQHLRRSRDRVFILEPNKVVLEYLRARLASRYALCLFSDEDSLIRELSTDRKPNLVLLAWDGNSRSCPILAHVRALIPDVPVILLSCFAELEDVEFVTRLGPSEIVLKPFVDNDLESSIEGCLASFHSDADIATPTEIPLNDDHCFVHANQRMRELEFQAKMIARSDIPILILGESGTGKEILAMYTHKMSLRSQQIFFKVNCAAMPADLLESELFGYEQGAFTGASKTKPGKFEICSGGTIFLDEIGEMSTALQPKLLQVLQDGTFSRLGSRTSMKTDVRIIAATNINMKEAIAQKVFREDLYYRLNGFSLVLPPLRERRDEIRIMAEYFMRKGAKRYGREQLTFSPGLLRALIEYSWPGNLRELENLVNRYLIFGDERAVLAELNAFTGIPPSTTNGELPPSGGLKQLVRCLKGNTEAVEILSVLEETGWNRKKAAGSLQISYKALLYKIKQYNLVRRRF